MSQLTYTIISWGTKPKHCPSALAVSHLLKYLAYGGGEAPLLPLESLSAAVAARGGALGEVGNSIMLPEFGRPFDLLGTELEKIFSGHVS